MNIVTKIRVNSWSNSLCALMHLWICPFSSTNVEDPLQIDLFMQNKPNVKSAQINVNSYMKSKYEKLDTWLSGKNKANSNPIKPNLKRAKMNINLYVIEDYRKKDDFLVRINKPNLQNAKNERKLNFNKGLQKKRLFSSPKNKPNSNPIKPNFFLDLIIKEPIVIFYKYVIIRNSLKKIIIQKGTRMSEKNRSKIHINNPISRRSMLQMVAGTGAAGAAALGIGSCAAFDISAKRRATEGRINQSIVYWCFEKHWDIEQTCRAARLLGCKSVELVDPLHWPILRKYGLICALHGSHGFDKGMNNPEYQDMCIEKIRDSIDACYQYGYPSVITFTGFRENIPDDVGIINCVNGYKKIIRYAERMKVNLCLEILNSRVDIEMKGHPGYQGDHTEYCMEIIRRVGSPRMKLLFDIYHVQVMDGDIIARIRQYKDYIGHYHTAGNPGRGELDDKQEINYKPIMEEIIRTGYTGYVGQEFIPTGNPFKSLREAVVLCDV